MPQGLPTVIPNEVITSSHINSIADRIVGRFANATERDAAITSPVNGMVVALTTPGLLQVRRGGAWRLAAPVPVHSTVPVNAGQGGDFSTASATEFGPTVPLSAPPEGATHLVGTFSVANCLPTGSGYVQITFRVRSVPNNNNGDGLNPAYITLLTPGTNYTVAVTSRWPAVATMTGLRMLIAKSGTATAFRLPEDGSLITFEGQWVAF